ncbi:MAG: Ppx/GppA family phosphatase [Eggerthellaceae bacterium]|nr:Ppx/GppA family phosphatase [Eggerthellaceae bacterium]
MEQCHCVIDIGTVTCRMLLAVYDPDNPSSLREIAHLHEITDLGRGVDGTGYLSHDGINHVETAIRKFISVRDASAPKGMPLNTICVATSATRDAKNADKFKSMLRTYGLEPRVITGQEEGAASFAGATLGMEGKCVMMVDSGGGSTETVIGVAGQRPLFIHSFQVGCRRVTDRFLLTDTYSEEQLFAAYDWIKKTMEPVLGGALEALEAKGLSMEEIIAVAGSATSAVSIRDVMDPYDPAKVHGQTVSADDLNALIMRLSAAPQVMRRRVIGLEPERAGVIVGGFLILRAVLDITKKPFYRASENDLLQGIILQSAR